MKEDINVMVNVFQTFVIVILIIVVKSNQTRIEKLENKKQNKKKYFK